MLPADKVPSFDEKGSSHQDCERLARSWIRMTHLDPSRRAAALVLHVNSVARRVCTSAGGGPVGSNDGASRILEISENYFAPESATRFTREWCVFFIIAGRTNRLMRLSWRSTYLGAGRSPKW